MSAPYGGAAFPCADQTRPQEGMTLRDWFAGMAMMGSIASDQPQWTCDDGLRVKKAYEVADAMLAERAKGAKP
jgi:hypothetical protein